MPEKEPRVHTWRLPLIWTLVWDEEAVLNKQEEAWLDEFFDTFVVEEFSRVFRKYPHFTGSKKLFALK